MISHSESERDRQRLVCPKCKNLLEGQYDLSCIPCGARYPILSGIADFSGGTYYDEFTPGQQLTIDHLRGLENEIAGTAARINEFYVPWIRQIFGQGSLRVLDCGCGNGLSVDLLNAAGFDAWGNDLSSLRKHQWLDRQFPSRLVVADSRSLPFPDSFFDVVIASGIIEHLGVIETGTPAYSVSPLPDKDEQRLMFLRELARIVAPHGRIFLDFPNGAFPIDFWHGRSGGLPRWHARNEGFLPTFREIRDLVTALGPTWRVIASSPRGRLRFRQVGRHWYGRFLRLPAAVFLWVLSKWPFQFLARTAINPFLVLELRRQG